MNFGLKQWFWLETVSGGYKSFVNYCIILALYALMEPSSAGSSRAFSESEFSGRSTCAKLLKSHLDLPSSLIATRFTSPSFLGMNQLLLGVDSKPDIEQVASYVSIRQFDRTITCLESISPLGKSRNCWMKGLLRGKVKAGDSYPVWRGGCSQFEVLIPANKLADGKGWAHKVRAKTSQKVRRFNNFWTNANFILKYQSLRKKTLAVLIFCRWK